MPGPSTFSRSNAWAPKISLTSNPLLDVLVPALHGGRQSIRVGEKSNKRHYHGFLCKNGARYCEKLFFSALLRAGSCAYADRNWRQSALQTKGRLRTALCSAFHSTGSHLGDPSSHSPGGKTRAFETSSRGETTSRSLDDTLNHWDSSQDAGHVNLQTEPSSTFFHSNIAHGSYLPRTFYEDLDKLQAVLDGDKSQESGKTRHASGENEPRSTTALQEQLQLLRSVRDLESRLAQARAKLHQALDGGNNPTVLAQQGGSGENLPAVVLSKEDYLNLVDLYYYSHRSRFGPDSPDYSPTPIFLEDYSFKLSADFSKPTAEPESQSDDEERYVSPLKHIEEMLKSRQIREIAVMQTFVDLLIDENSSDRLLFEAYKKFPDPGVSYLPSGIVRLFLQRMSTPQVKSEKAVLRYLSLIDDMQTARLPITISEWSSAIYLAGRSFSKVRDTDVSNAFRIWRQMEQEAGVKSNHVTFNILFDIAVRAGKFVLGETVLKEMHQRGLRLNRLGRVSLIYYHGLRRDGDGVRQAYRDFVEAGEIVDTLVLNCVIAALIIAQEPVAAEQVYERMKDLHVRLRRDTPTTYDEGLFARYPPPGPTLIDNEMASNSLGRVLLRSAHLRNLLPEHHAALQNSMSLTPDHFTFRRMVAYHAVTSGNLDRLTVLMNDMTELFGLPFTSLTFHLLFKGFALHGASTSEGNQWTSKRLDLVWASCVQAIKDGQKARRLGVENHVHVPTIQQVNAEMVLEMNTQPNKLSGWQEFVRDVGILPPEQSKVKIKGQGAVISEAADPGLFTSSVFRGNLNDHPSSFDKNEESEEEYPSSAVTDDEEGYTLPSPQAQFIPPPLSSTDTSSPADDSGGEARSTSLQHHKPARRHQQVKVTKPLVTWLLRAYRETTHSRHRVEEVWAQVRRWWRPADTAEVDAVLKVLKRVLRDCDRMGEG